MRKNNVKRVYYIRIVFFDNRQNALAYANGQDIRTLHISQTVIRKYLSVHTRNVRTLLCVSSIFTKKNYFHKFLITFPEDKALPKDSVHLKA